MRQMFIAIIASSMLAACGGGGGGGGDSKPQPQSASVPNDGQTNTSVAPAASPSTPSMPAVASADTSPQQQTPAASSTAPSPAPAPVVPPAPASNSSATGGDTTVQVNVTQQVNVEQNQQHVEAHVEAPPPAGTPSVNPQPSQPTTEPSPVADSSTDKAPVTAPTPPAPTTLPTSPISHSQAMPANLPPSNRSTIDRPDDSTAAQIHVVYAIPADGVDRGWDRQLRLVNTIGSFNNWLAQQTGGRKFRMDTYQGKLDITFVRLPRSDADYVSYGWSKRDRIEADMRAQGLVQSNKVYLVYYDGTNPLTCGDAAYHQDASIGTVAVIYVKGGGVSFAKCEDNGFAPSETAAPTYLDYAWGHEVLHAIGMLASNAHGDGKGHVLDDPKDLMYQGPDPTYWNGPKTLDVAHDDYWNPQGPIPNGLPNLAQSPYLQ